MDFAQVEAEFERLKGQFERGALTEADFKGQLEELMIKDEQGRWWILGYETGRWYVHDGEKWVQQQPPRAAPGPPPAEPERPRAAGLAPDSQPKPAAAATIEMPAGPEVASSPERQAAPPPAAAPLDTERQGAQRAAKKALWFAIVGLFIPVILALVAIVQARKARKVLGPGDPGHGKAVTAEIISWIGLVLWVLCFGLLLLG